jgi:RNA 2',3'-cyclic 3'-phosphodiesterase
METKPVRLFLAALIPQEVRAVIDAAVAPLRAQTPQIRWVRADLWHLTLIFLAERPADQLGIIRDTVSTACRHEAPFGVRIDGIGCFPNANRPRVLWIGVCPGSDALGALRRRVLGALQHAGLNVDDERFSAHLTIGRVRDNTTPDVRAVIGRQWTGMALTRLPLFDVDEIHLMRSKLGPGGPEYTSLAALPLVGSLKL